MRIHLNIIVGQKFGMRTKRSQARTRYKIKSNDFTVYAQFMLISW